MTTMGTEAAVDHRRPYRYYVLLLLTFVYVFNFVDRQLIGIVSPAIKADLNLPDWQLGLLKGFAFAALYTVLGIPVARLADRYHRVTIVSVSLGLWSAFTVLSGFAQNFVQLALARVGVGIGEAGGTPPSHSVLSDYFPKEERAGALAVFALGVPLGMAFAYLAGGWLTQTYGWRMTFVIVGIPGVLLAILLRATVREPTRGAQEKGAYDDAFKSLQVGEPEDTVERLLRGACRVIPKRARGRGYAELVTIWRVAKHLLRIPTYRRMVIATTAVSFSSYALGTWVVDFFTRSHPDYPFIRVMVWLGVISGTAYAAGTFMGGFLVDRLAARNKAMYGIVPALGVLLAAPFLAVALWVDEAGLAIALLAPVNFALGFYLGPAFAVAQTLAPVSARALSTAIFFLILNMIALGFGPTAAGAISSVLVDAMGEGTALRVALTATSTALLIGAYAFFRAGQSMAADWQS